LTTTRRQSASPHRALDGILLAASEELDLDALGDAL
jgi:hypothetical protein